MKYNKIIEYIINGISKELKTNDTNNNISNKIIKPIINNTIYEFYPYILGFIIFIIIIFILIICIFLLNIKLCYK